MRVQDASRAAFLRALNCGVSDTDARAAMVAIAGAYVNGHYMDRIIRESLQQSCVAAGQTVMVRDLLAVMVECVFTDRGRPGVTTAVNRANEALLAVATPLMHDFVAEVIAVHLNVPVEWAAAYLASQVVQRG